jgi:hypothetical protein
LVAAGGPNTYPKKYPGPPGGAVAARRELWKNGGLYPFCIVGGGDSVLMYTAYQVGEQKIHRVFHGVEKNNKKFEQWSKSVSDYINGSISFIDGGVIHEWHGTRDNRQYNNRYNIIKTMDIENQAVLNEIGLVEILKLDKTLHAKIYLYFKNRREDG